MNSSAESSSQTAGSSASASDPEETGKMNSMVKVEATSEKAIKSSTTRRLSYSSDTDAHCPKRVKVAGKDGSPMVIRVGSRKSKLALVQTEIVIEALKEIYDQDYEFEIVTMTTTGDHILDTPLSQIGSKSLFTKELEEALLDKTIHFVVHSLKDVPTTLPPELCIAAILRREDPEDALVLKSSLKLEDPLDLVRPKLSKGNEIDKTSGDNNCKDSVKNGSIDENSEKLPVIGTSSLRRIAQLRKMNPTIKVVDVRGNLTTRINKLDDPQQPYDALILASSGLKRSDLASRISTILDSNWWYAVGQGALAVECREDDSSTMALLSPLIDYRSTYEAICERAFMQTLEGGCSVPLGVRCKWIPHMPSNSDLSVENSDLILSLDGAVFSLDGTEFIEDCQKSKIFDEVKEKSEEKSSEQKNNGNIKNFTSICLPPPTLACFDRVKRAFLNSFKLGVNLANQLNAQGAGNILAKIKHDKEKK
ncbi:porphobilinogen deaminase-like [Brevipalpus obovatus]|uniref:porphobilinogen deaminase-like n=1 Tax=Brevipalpus obovatus TaxID=246614 RepID=UPI003D9F2825